MIVNEINSNVSRYVLPEYTVLSIGRSRGWVNPGQRGYDVCTIKLSGPRGVESFFFLLWDGGEMPSFLHSGNAVDVKKISAMTYELIDLQTGAVLQVDSYEWDGGWIDFFE